MKTDLITLLLNQFKDGNLLRSPWTQNQEALQCFCSCWGKVGLGALWKDTFQPFYVAFLLTWRAHISFSNRCYSTEIRGAGRELAWNLRVVLNCNSCWFLWRCRGYFQALKRACCRWNRRGCRMQDISNLCKRRTQYELFVSCTFEIGPASLAGPVSMMIAWLFKATPADDDTKRPAGGQCVPAQEPHQHGQQCRRFCGNNTGPQSVHLCSQDDRRDLLRLKK